MIIKTLDGYEKKWNFNKSRDSLERSNLHLEVRGFLKSEFPTVYFLEEIQIPVKKNKYLYLDFYLPIYNIAIESDGEQHEKKSSYFHKNPFDFIKQKINDRAKNSWCELNNIRLIRLKYDESYEQWMNKFKYEKN